MIVSINQPAYLPWDGYFSRIAKSDVHVVLDHVRMSSDSMTNRNRIRGKDGPIMLTVPIKNRGGSQAIRDIEICNDQDWCNKHFQSIWQNYSKAPFFTRHMPTFSNIYKCKWTSLSKLITLTNEYFLEQFEIDTEIVHSYDLKARGEKSDLVLNICKELKATVYISGPFGRDYLNSDHFADAGIEIWFHEPPASLSAIDRLFHQEGFEI